MRDNALAQWVIGGFSVVAFILLLKFGVSYLPDSGPLGAFKRVVAGI